MSEVMEQYIEWAVRRGTFTEGAADRMRGYAETVERLGLPDVRATYSALHAAAEADDSYIEDSLGLSARRIAQIEEELRDARKTQRMDIVVASLAGMPETKIARLGEVNRRTVRAALGKN